MIPLIVDPTLPHQIVLRYVTGDECWINVSCNCRRYGQTYVPIAVLRPENGTVPMLAAYAKAHK